MSEPAVSDPAATPTEPASTDPTPSPTEPAATPAEPGKTTLTTTEPPPPGAPEKYSLNFGDGLEPDAALLKEFEDISREGNISNELAQKYADLYARTIADANARIETQIETWNSEAMSDPEIGGKDHEAKWRLAQSLVKRFGTPKLIEALDESGFGSNPELVRFCMRIARHVGEDTLGDTPPGTPQISDKDAELRRMYPSMYDQDGKAKEL